MEGEITVGFLSWKVPRKMLKLVWGLNIDRIQIHGEGSREDILGEKNFK